MARLFRKDVVAFSIFPADGAASAAIGVGTTTIDLKTRDVRSPGRKKRQMSSVLRNDLGETLAQAMYIESDQPIVVDVQGDANPVLVAANDPTHINTPTRNVRIHAAVVTNLRIIFSIYVIPPFSRAVAMGGSAAGAPTVLDHGQTAVGVAATALRAALAIANVTIVALTTNPATVFYGGAAVTIADGVPLLPGGVATIDIDDVDKVRVIAAAVGNTVAWITEGDV